MRELLFIPPILKMSTKLSKNDVFCCRYYNSYAYISNMSKLKYFIEYRLFGVCTSIGERVGIATSRIRMYFIYLTFCTLGSPIIIYFFIAFWMNIKRYIWNARRNPLRYL